MIRKNLGIGEGGVLSHRDSSSYFRGHLFIFVCVRRSDKEIERKSSSTTFKSQYYIVFVYDVEMHKSHAIRLWHLIRNLWKETYKLTN